eukprot:6849544-Pyramimonas_sp.AAC.1
MDGQPAATRTRSSPATRRERRPPRAHSAVPPPNIEKGARVAVSQCRAPVQQCMGRPTKQPRDRQVLRAFTIKEDDEVEHASGCCFS